MTKVLLIGDRRRQSWEIRARQIGEHCGWSFGNRLEPADVVIAIKHIDQATARAARAMGAKVVLDVLDFWRQPGSLHVNEGNAREWFRAQVIRPLAGLLDGIIWPNSKMHEDLGGDTSTEMHIYHHWHPSLRPIEVRDELRVLAYQGAEVYLGDWRPMIEAACRKHGVRFVVNPPDMAIADAAIAVRGGVHNTWVARNYKSNVKLATCYGLAMPCLLQWHCSYAETAHKTVQWLPEQPCAKSVADGLDLMKRVDVRLGQHQDLLGRRFQFSLERISETYRGYVDLIAKA